MRGNCLGRDSFRNKNINDYSCGREQRIEQRGDYKETEVEARIRVPQNTAYVGTYWEN